jgi:hypothetical protein
LAHANEGAATHILASEFRAKSRVRHGAGGNIGAQWFTIGNFDQRLIGV